MKKSDLSVIHIGSSISGGGAGRVILSLSRFCADKNIGGKCLFINQSQAEQSEDLTSLNYTALGDFSIIRRFFRLREEIIKESKKTKNLIVHCHLSNALYFGFFLKFFVRSKWIYTEHNTHNRRRSIPLFRPIEWVVYRNFDMVVCISQGTRDCLADWIGPLQKCIVIHNGSRLFPRPNMSKGKIDQPLNLLSVGSTIKSKGFDRSLRALSKLSDKKWIYSIVGDGPELLNLKFLARSLGIEDKIVFAGNIGCANALQSYYHKADVQLIPSLWEGFGLVAVEGMSSGLLVVASRLSGLSEVLGENSKNVKYVENPANEKEWVEVLESMRDAIGARTTKDVRETEERAHLFSVDTMTSKYYSEVYSQLWGRR